MRPSIESDAELVREAQALSGIRTRRELIHRASREFVDNRTRLDLRELGGLDLLDPEYDHKGIRARTRFASTRGSYPNRNIAGRCRRLLDFRR